MAGTNSGGVYRSNINDINWVPANTGLSGSTINCFAVNDSGIFVGTQGSGISYSTNNGANWSKINNGLGNKTVTCLAISGTNIFAGTYGFGIFISTNNGSSWEQVNNGLKKYYVRSLTSYGKYILAGIDDDGVYLSTDNGTIWKSINDGLTETIISSFLINGTKIFASAKGGIWWRNLLEVTSTKETYSYNIISKFYLKQNYPNPFNPTTNIGFQIANFGFVSLKVYDIFGREVATLVNEEKRTGNYEVEFNGSGLSSGIYFYKLYTKNYTSVKKMILMK